MGLKKLLKKARKAVGLPALTLGTAAKVGAAVATGGLGAGALALGTAALRSKLKSAAVGGVKQVVRAKAQKALLKRASKLAPPTIVPVRAQAQTMPGGAPLKGVVVKRASRKAKAPAKRARKATTRRTGGGRKPPKGGLDLKALSASWKAAGKPGKWIDWVKKG